MCCFSRYVRALIVLSSLSLPIIKVDALMNAVINTDASLINEGTSSQGSFTLRSAGFCFYMYTS